MNLTTEAEKRNTCKWFFKFASILRISGRKWVALFQVHLIQKIDITKKIEIILQLIRTSQRIATWSGW